MQWWQSLSIKAVCTSIILYAHITKHCVTIQYTQMVVCVTKATLSLITSHSLL